MKTEIIDTSTTEVLNKVHENRIGSSAICSVAGLNPFETPLQLWLKKTGRVERDPENDAMWLGTKLEPIVAEMYNKRFPGPFEKNSNSAVPIDRPWMVATPDYFIGENGAPEILEIKTTTAWAKQKWEDGIPDYAHCQVQWQMGIWGCERAKIACLVGGRELIVKDCAFEKDIFEQLVELGEQFMGFVKSDTPPEVRGDDIEALKKLLIPTPGKVLPISVEMVGYAQRYLESKKKIAAFKESIKPLEDDCKLMEVHIRKLLGDAEMAGGLDYQIIRKCTVRKGYTVKESVTDSLKIKCLNEVEASND